MKIIASLMLLAFLGGCAPLVVGGVAGVGAYRYNKCERWVETAYGPKKVWACKHYLSGE